VCGLCASMCGSVAALDGYAQYGTIGAIADGITDHKSWSDVSEEMKYISDICEENYKKNEILII